MKKIAHNIFNAWRYYMIGRDAYTKCVDTDFANNLTNMILSGVIFFMFTIFAIVNWGSYGTLEAILFPSLAIMSLLFTAASMRKYKQHRIGKKVSNRFIFAMMLGAYTAVMLSSVYIDVLLTPTAVAVIFMTFLVGGVLLLPAIAILSLLMNLGVLVIYTAFSLVVITPECCWVCELAPAAFGMVVGVSFAWYVNMHKMVAAYNKIELEKERDQYRAQSTMDELTKLPNRRAFTQRFERYLKNRREKDNFLCCAVIDIDYFKYFNDRYGHVAGDECLRKIGEILSKPYENPSAYAARIGGEEFALIWFGEKKEECEKTVLQLLNRIKELDIPHEKSEAARHITVSIGAYVAPSGMHDSQHVMYNLADNMLYEAKEKGRNRAVVLDENSEKHTIYSQ